MSRIYKNFPKSGQEENTYSDSNFKYAILLVYKKIVNEI